ncbi:cystathionine gamma-synthase [Halobacteriales archaeon SW_5_70_135]|nr:MAG: cystathionine gamma-synthase [Halobacteriales archaeon SW_5_70_135]
MSDDRDRKTTDDRFETRSIHAGQEPDPETGALMTPIHANSTYEQDGPGEDRGYEYSRTANPTRTDLEANLASLESAAHGRAFSSGMGAVNTVLNLLEAGDHVVSGDDIYGGTYRVFEEVYRDYGLTFDYVDTTDLDALEEAMRPATELVWVETPTNPLMRVTDVEAAAGVAHEHGALCTVDNTFATPYLQRPVEHGADLVVQSLTKYLGGHSDVVGGAVLTDDADLARHLAGWLDAHEAVSRVYYPGLESHPGHATARKQMDDFGGMLSFELDASLEETARVVSETELFTLAESLGGVESLIEQPAAMTHASIPREQRVEAGLTDGLVRASVGIEHVEDLREDLDRAIEIGVE